MKPRSGNILLFRESRATDGRFHVRNKACASTLTRISVCTLSSVVVTNLSVCLFVCQQVACDVVTVYTLDRSRRAMSVSQLIGQSRSDPWSLHSWNPYYIPLISLFLLLYSIPPPSLSQSLATFTFFSLPFFLFKILRISYTIYIYEATCVYKSHAASASPARRVDARRAAKRKKPRLVAWPGTS